MRRVAVGRVQGRWVGVWGQTLGLRDEGGNAPGLAHDVQPEASTLQGRWWMAGSFPPYTTASCASGTIVGNRAPSNETQYCLVP